MPNLPNPVPRGTAGIDHDTSHDELHGDHNKYTAAGALLAGTGPGATSTVPPPTATGQILTADMASVRRMGWAAIESLGFASQASLDAALLALEDVYVASHTLVLANANRVVAMNVSAANTVTIPPNSSVAFPVGTIIEVFQLGSGPTTISPGTGVTLRSFGNKLTLAGVNAVAGLRKRATNEWVVSGDLS